MDGEKLKAAKAKLLKEFAGFELKPFRTFAVRYALTMLPLVVIATLAFISPSLWIFVAIAITAGFTQNGLVVLMHEGSHYFFHRNRKANDVITDFLVCLPVFNTVEGYRRPHFEHHRHSGEEVDPYYEIYADYDGPMDVVRGLICDITGISAVRLGLTRYLLEGRGKDPDNPPSRGPWYALPGLLVMQSLIFLIMWQLTGSLVGYFFLWLLPLLTIPIAINRFRTIVEHYPGFMGIRPNRTTLTGLIDYLCVAPYGYGHHHEHHLMPILPYHCLGWAHGVLEREGVEFTENEINTYGYLHTFWRMMREMRTLQLRNRETLK